MRYLLDVNTLVAYGVLDHEFHAQVNGWITSLRADETPELASCSITELGFLRTLANVKRYASTIAEAKNTLMKTKTTTVLPWTFLMDGQDVTHLPQWVETAKRTTDGHLLLLARANNALLATLDRGIPGAFWIPQIH